MFLWITIVGNIIFFLYPTNIPSGNLYSSKETSVAVDYGVQYRKEKQSNYVVGASVYTGWGNRFFRPMGGVYLTGNNSYFISLGVSKDILITEKLAITSHVAPSISYITGKDKLNNSGFINYNLSIGAYYTVTKNLAVGVEWRHFSNLYADKPNEAIDTYGIKFRYRL